MNSVRIGITGMMVDRWGTQAADGFLHFFEGWIIFIACAAFLGFEILLFALVTSRKSFFDVFYLPQIKVGTTSKSPSDWRDKWSMASGLSLLSLTGIVILFVTTRTEVVPERTRFVSFPSQLGEWRGRTSLLEPQEEHVLNLDDYIISNYSNREGRGLNLYVAYYASQRKGASPHSPIVCLPGGGWLITKFERTSVGDGVGTTMPLNRVIMEQGSNKQLVYYWFVQRGRHVANEYWSKWYLLIDAIFKNRTDGALVRLVTPIYSGEHEPDADQRLLTFMRELNPTLSAYLPAETAVRPKLAENRP
jgi:exosortase D (VPLPA-CTERM-specific)